MTIRRLISSVTARVNFVFDGPEKYIVELLHEGENIAGHDGAVQALSDDELRDHLASFREALRPDPDGTPEDLPLPATIEPIG